VQEQTDNEASLALVAFRKALGLTQQAFAVEIMKSAVTTVARWETGNPPPRGDALVRLAEAADEHGLPKFGNEFRYLYMDEVIGSLKFHGLSRVYSESEYHEPRGYLIRKLGGSDYVVVKFNTSKSIAAAIDFLVKQLHQFKPEKGK